MIENGRSLLIDCLEALCGDAETRQIHYSPHGILQSVEELPASVSHLWCEHGCLVGDILEALPLSLYEHEATTSLLSALEGEVVECVRCLQAYHTAQVGFHSH